jgi:hypothetical protein
MEEPTRARYVRRRALNSVAVADCHDVEEVPVKDKHYRKYASGVDRAISLFDTALEEWADYISFLNRLLKVRKVM